jgi:hypothetical protein
VSSCFENAAWRALVVETADANFPRGFVTLASYWLVLPSEEVADCAIPMAQPPCATLENSLFLLNVTNPVGVRGPERVKLR